MTGRVLAGAALVALSFSVPAFAQDVRVGKRNPGAGSVSTPTRVACNTKDPLQPCLGLRNRGTGRAFTFSSLGTLGGRINVGRGGSEVKPFTTNATGVATGLNADRVDGMSADQIIRAAVEQSNLRPLPRLTDADTLDGRDSSAFLAVNGVAADAAKLGGLAESAFLRANGKAADADLLDGQNSTAFLGATAKAADAELLDGQDSTAFLAASRVTAGGERVELSTSDPIENLLSGPGFDLYADCNDNGGLTELEIGAASDAADTWIATSSPSNNPAPVQLTPNVPPVPVFTADAGGSFPLSTVTVSVSTAAGVTATGQIAIGFGVHGADCTAGGTLVVT